MQFRLLKIYLEGIKKDASQTANISIDSGSQTRTDDNLINSQVLYQLSYAGITHQHKILYHVDKSLQTIILNFIYQNY